MHLIPRVSRALPSAGLGQDHPGVLCNWCQVLVLRELFLLSPVQPLLGFSGWPIQKELCHPVQIRRQPHLLFQREKKPHHLRLPPFPCALLIICPAAHVCAGASSYGQSSRVCPQGVTPHLCAQSPPTRLSTFALPYPLPSLFYL